MQVPDTDDIKIVGNLPELGSWDVDLAPSLLCARDKSFRRLRCLPPDTELVFKVVRIPNGANGAPVQPDDTLENIWEDGENRVVTTGPASSGLRLNVEFSGPMEVQEGNAQDLQVCHTEPPSYYQLCSQHCTAQHFHPVSLLGACVVLAWLNLLLVDHEAPHELEGDRTPGSRMPQHSTACRATPLPTAAI